MKMFCRILLLVSLTAYTCGMFVAPEALNYQAEEGTSVTVEWCFSSKTSISVPSFKMHCVTVLEVKVFYNLDSSVNESLHEQFAGRVQCDIDALRTGCVRLHVAAVRMNDSGRYLCRMVTGSGKEVREFSLSITAAAERPETTTATPAPEMTKPAPEMTTAAPTGQRRTCLYIVLGLAAVAVAAAVLATSCRSSHSKGVPELLLLSAGVKRNLAAENKTSSVGEPCLA